MSDARRGGAASAAVSGRIPGRRRPPLLCGLLAAGCALAAAAAAPPLPVHGGEAAGPRPDRRPAPKKVVSVAPFSFARAGAAWNLVGGMQAQLVNALKRSGRFVVREGDLLTEVLREEDLAASGRTADSHSARIGRVLAAQYLVRGTVTEFEIRGDVDKRHLDLVLVDIDRSVSRARLAVVVDLIDTTTGTVVASGRVEGTAETRDRETGVNLLFLHFRFGKERQEPSQRVVQECIDRAVRFVDGELDSLPWSSSVVKGGPAGIIIRGGEEEGIRVGDEFRVVRRRGELQDPESGQVLGVETVPVARIRVAEVSRRVARAEVTSGGGVERGDLVSVQ